MITKLEARTLVKQAISKTCAEVECEIIDSETLEHDWGWVFFYNSCEYLNTGNIIAALAGNAPFIVNRQTGELVSTGTARPTAEYVQEYEGQLKEESRGDT